MTDQPNRVVALTTSVTLEPNDSRRLASLCGPFDQNLKFIERRMGVRIRNRGNEFQLSGQAPRVEASEVLVSDLLDTFSKTPRLATAVLWAASRDEAMVVEHLVGIGRRDAKERTAHFLLELGARLKLVGLGTALGYSCPLSQYLLADAMGLSAVHVNRVLRELREDGLVTFQQGKVTIHDLDGLVVLADFDKSYLDHDGPLLK